MPGRVDEGVPVDLAEADELRPLEPRQEAQDPLLFGPLQARLETDEVVLALGEVLAPQLRDRPRPAPVRGAQAHRLERAEAQGLLAAPGELFDRQTALEEERLLEIAQRHHLGREERLAEGAVALPVEGRVEVILAGPLAVARGAEEPRPVERLALHDRGDRVVEVEPFAAEQLLQERAHRRRGERTGGDDDLACGQGRDLGADDLDPGGGGEGGGHAAGERLPVDGERPAGRHRRGAGGADDERAEPFHLPLEQPGGVVGVVAPQRVAADELGEIAGLVGRRRAFRTHLVEHHRHPAAGELPGALGAGEAAADDVDARGAGAGHGAATRGGRGSSGPRARGSNGSCRSGRSC
ncbi:MAG: hypothetical protein BWX64_02735 [Acidobacteria bacterium ADurb.Bin051]|nr:MAG: hypothetical protein BWX64_02735 [Acidobacteria bacterium ADurb.Bin051]